jgi:hypothetical protein
MNIENKSFIKIDETTNWVIQKYYPPINEEYLEL